MDDTRAYPALVCATSLDDYRVRDRSASRRDFQQQPCVRLEGQEFNNVGCYLDVVPKERLIFTDTLLPGYRPSPNPFFTAVLQLAANGSGTRYTATAIHGDEEARKKHEDMGFHDGWGTVVTQMVAFIQAGFKTPASS